MKTNKEMAESVLERASAIKEKQKVARHWTSGVLAGVICLVLILGLAAAPRNPKTPTPTGGQLVAPPTQPTAIEPTQEVLPLYTGNVLFLGSAVENEVLMPMQADMTIPVMSMIRVRSLKGLSEKMVINVIDEEKAFKEEFKEKYYDRIDGARFGYLETDDIYIQYLNASKPSLILPNEDLVESTVKETEGVFHVDGGDGFYNKDVTIGNGDNTYTIPKGCLRVYLHVSLSGESIEMLTENPDLPLSTFKDTITVTVNLKDGSKAVIKVDVTMNDEGQIFMTMRGSTAL